MKKDNFNIAVDLAMKGDFEEPLKVFNKVINNRKSLNSQLYAAYVNRGNVRHHLKDFKGALEDFECAIIINQEDCTVYVDRGNIWDELGFYELAMNDYNMSLKIDSHCIEALVNRGNLNRKLQNIKKALRDLNKAIKLDPKNTSAYLNRGLLKEDTMNYEGALKDYSTAIDIEPDFTDGYYYLYTLLIDHFDDSELAEEYLKTAARLGHKTTELYLYLRNESRN